MIRYVRAVPMAFLTGGCVARSQAVTQDALYAEAPRVEYRAKSTAEQALARWQLPPQSGWAPYSKYTLLTAMDQNTYFMIPDIRQSSLVSRAECAAAALSQIGLPARTLWIVDLPGAASVAFGATLSRASSQPIAPILTFNNWPADQEMIPAEQTLSALLSYEPRMPEGPAAPVFLLDRWRLAYRSEVPPESVTDNRYMLNATDLPSGAQLNAAGIDAVIYVVEEASAKTFEEDDLNAIFVGYQEAGIRIGAIGLGDYCVPEPPNYSTYPTVYGGWYPIARTYPSLWPLRCRARHTILEDTEFYRRAHGGFGGFHASPTHSVRIAGGAHAATGG